VMNLSTPKGMGPGFPLREWVSRSQDFESFCVEKLLDFHYRHSGDSSRFAAARDPCSVALWRKSGGGEGYSGFSRESG
jgi:hypothetical protein